MIKVLLIEDDEASAYVTQGGLELIGDYQVLLAQNGEEGWELYNKEKPDIVVSDIDMPLMNGYELVRKIREVNPTVIIIMESGKTAPKDVLKGFESGVDDYIKKPFVAEELHVRIQTILKRVGNHPQPNVNVSDSSDYFYIGNYKFDINEDTLELRMQKMKLTKREADILKMLHNHKNTIVSRDEILTTFWESNDYFNSRSLDVFISKLRKYLAHDPSIRIITIRGKGIKLEII